MVVERSLGTALPGDFKAFTQQYGSGTVDDFLYLFNPFAAGQDGNLLAKKDRVLAAYRQTRARFPDRLPCPRSRSRAGCCRWGAPTTATSCTG